ncbi:hypothetical protein [Tomitella biformata]|nr:hypothetical protein [Tomitella biformata]
MISTVCVDRREIPAAKRDQARLRASDLGKRYGWLHAPAASDR